MSGAELVDLVDASGQVVDRGVPREKAEKHPTLFMRIVGLVATNSEGYVLYQIRHRTKSLPYHYDHVYGAVLSGEDPAEAAAREASEETGLVLSSSELVQAAAGVNEYGFYRILFLVLTDQVPAPDAGKREVESAGFATIEELLALQASGKPFVKGFFEDLKLAGVTK